MVDLDRLERILIQAARERRPVTYGQLLALFERRVTRITVAALCRDLGRVAHRREGEGWPNLACLVVRRSDGLPGGGYFEDLRRDGAYTGPNEGEAAHAFVGSRQEAAYRWAAAREAPRLPAVTERAAGARADACYLDEVAPAASRSR